MKKLALSISFILSLLSVSNATYPMMGRISQRIMQNATKNTNSMLGKAAHAIRKKIESKKQVSVQEIAYSDHSNNNKKTPNIFAYHLALPNSLNVLQGKIYHEKNARKNEASTSFRNTAAHSQQFSTIFCHGLNAGPTQAAKYKPEHVSFLTGEKISCTKGIDVLLGPVTAPAMSEIRLLPTQKKGWLPSNFIQRITAWYISRKHLNEYGIKVHQGSSDLTVNGHALDRSKSNIGQEVDIEKLRAAFKSHIQRYPDHKYVMYGCSRGAAATFSLVCLNNNDEDLLKNVKAVVLEGCFDSVSSLLVKRYSYLLGKHIETALEYAMSYKKKGISPISVAHQWPAEIPVLFVTSTKDKEVPTVCTQNLIDTLKQKVPNAQIYMMMLHNSSHPRYVYDDRTDRENYENGVHAFYKLQGMPCDEIKAARGAGLLKKI